MARMVEGGGHKMVEAERAVLEDLLPEQVGDKRCHIGESLCGLIAWGEIDERLRRIKLSKDERPKHLVVGHSPAVAIDGPG